MSQDNDDKQFENFLLSNLDPPPEAPQDEWRAIHQEISKKMDPSLFLGSYLRLAWPSMVVLALCFFVVFYNFKLYQQKSLDSLLEASLSMDYSWESTSSLPTLPLEFSEQEPI